MEDAYLSASTPKLRAVLKRVMETGNLKLKVLPVEKYSVGGVITQENNNILHIVRYFS